MNTTKIEIKDGKDGYEPYDKYLMKWKEYKSNELKSMDFLHLVDTILNHESMNNKEFTYKLRNSRYVELKSMKIEDLIEIFLNYELLKKTPNNIKEELSLYERQSKDIRDKADIKEVEYMFDGDELKYWDKDNPTNRFDIDLNDFIDWDEVNEKAIEEMKENFKKGTVFIDIDDDYEV